MKGRSFSFVMVKSMGLGSERRNCLLCSDHLTVSLVWQDRQSQNHVPDSPCSRHQPPGQVLAAAPQVDHGPDGGVFPTGAPFTLWETYLAIVTVHIDIQIFLTEKVIYYQLVRVYFGDFRQNVLIFQINVLKYSMW